MRRPRTDCPANGRNWGQPVKDTPPMIHNRIRRRHRSLVAARSLGCDGRINNVIAAGDLKGGPSDDDEDDAPGGAGGMGGMM